MRQNYKERAWDLFKTSKRQSEYAKKVNIAQNENTSPQYHHPCIIRNLLFLQFPTFFNIYIHGSQLVLFSRKLEDTLDRDRLYLSLQKSLQPRTSLVKNISQLYCGTFTWRPFTLINTKWVQQWEKVVDLGGEKMGWHTGTVNVGSDVAGAPHCQAHLRPLNSAGDWCEHCCELKVPYSSFSRKLHPVHRGVWHCFIGDGGKKRHGHVWLFHWERYSTKKKTNNNQHWHGQRSSKQFNMRP